MHKNIAAGCAQGPDLFGIAAGLEPGEGLILYKAVDHGKFFFLCHDAHADLHEKTVQLCLGKGKRSERFHRILRRNDKKRILQRPGLTVYGYLMLRHAFQKGGLGARCCAVDLVRQQNMAKDRPFPEHKPGL